MHPHKLNYSAREPRPSVWAAVVAPLLIGFGIAALIVAIPLVIWLFYALSHATNL